MFFTIKLYFHLNCVLILNWIVWNRTIFIKMDLALNILWRLICYKTWITNQPSERPKVITLKLYRFSTDLSLAFLKSRSGLRALRSKKSNYTVSFEHKATLVSPWLLFCSRKVDLALCQVLSFFNRVLHSDRDWRNGVRSERERGGRDSKESGG